jgi:hypothetical protein
VERGLSRKVNNRAGIINKKNKRITAKGKKTKNT